MNYSAFSRARKPRTSKGFIIYLIIGALLAFLVSSVWMHFLGLLPILVSRSVSNSKIAALKIWTTFPPTMELKHSYVIEVSLISSTVVGFIPNSPVEAATAFSTSPTPVGTPGISLSDAFGKDYEGDNASASLFASTFNVKPSEPEYSSLFQDQTTWRWNVTPQESGKQVLSEEIKIIWEPIGGQANRVPISEIIGNPQISVQVKEAPFDWSLITIPVLVVVLGTFIVWFGSQSWQWITQRSRNKTKKKPTHVPSKMPVNRSKSKRRS